ncbi:thioesterase family protein [Rhodoferax sp. PAMC 29310]|uniref:acyl-CoA thioesterase n=1 Tax=Rhodoferax sp. PAMC 29310 TaxID=2822760 RepID=UPI001B3220BE|nr:thioesterase family protein [Rhodoferax sp. PAMC 29310]
MTSASSNDTTPGNTGAKFRQHVTVHFSHCDPAGMVFFPQYFVMLNNLVENWFTQGLGIHYATLIAERRIGLPTVSLQADFVAPSRMGETLEFALEVTRLGQKSLTLAVVGRGGHQVRLRLQQVLVTTSLDGDHAIDLPADVRAAISHWQSTSGVSS